MAPSRGIVSLHRPPPRPSPAAPLSARSSTGARGHGPCRAAGGRPDSGRGQDDNLAKLFKLQEAFAAEVGLLPGFAPSGRGACLVAAAGGGEESEDSELEGAATGAASGRLLDDGGSVCAQTTEAAHQPLQAGASHVGTVKLAGVFTAPDGSRSLAIPGYGRGVPPTTGIEHSVIINLRPGRPPIVVTAASDGENLLWAPALDWDRLGVMPFYSVFTCRREAASARRKGGGAGALPLGARAARLRETEAIRREREAKVVQTGHLDPDREIFISREMHTTVLQPLNFDVTERTYTELEDKRVLFGLPAHGDHPAKALEAIPNTPLGLLEVIKQRGRIQQRRDVKQVPYRALDEDVGHAPASSSLASAPGSPFAPAAAGAGSAGWLGVRPPAGGGRGGGGIVPVAAAPRESVQLTCLAAHPKIPRLVAGVGDGQLALYHVYRAHGHRRPQLHQTQGFDASRKCGDIATAAYVPAARLAQDGALNAEAVVVGFESGRVAVFRVLLPDSLGRAESADGGGAAAEGVLLASQPVLTEDEPLLQDHYFSESPVTSLMWHPVLGIISIYRDGTALMVDTNNVVTCSIACAAGRDVLVTAADLSLEHEQLAAAGQRGVHLWQCFSQAKMGVLEPPNQSVKKSTTLTLAVRYLPSQRFLLSAHELFGEVRVWDVLRLELMQSTCPPDCPRATCVTWDPLGMMLLVFGTMGVAALQLTEERGDDAARPPTPVSAAGARTGSLDSVCRPPPRWKVPAAGAGKPGRRREARRLDTSVLGMAPATR